ncbi:hypothetical protein AAVH_03138 [Aphelenchoides avenae]|nr:hypothetical protein AAVH_03138 [Aphelenchus avenae]
MESRLADYRAPSRKNWALWLTSIVSLRAHSEQATRRGPIAGSFKAAWKVVSLVGSDNLSNDMSTLSVQDASTACPSSSAQKDAIEEKRCTGVVCYKEGELCYVYPPQMAQPPSNIQAGHWLEFDA